MSWAGKFSFGAVYGCPHFCFQSLLLRIGHRPLFSPIVKRVEILIDYLFVVHVSRKDLILFQLLLAFCSFLFFYIRNYSNFERIFKKCDTDPLNMCFEHYSAECHNVQWLWIYNLRRFTIQNTSSDLSKYDYCFLTFFWCRDWSLYQPLHYLIIYETFFLFSNDLEKCYWPNIDNYLDTFILMTQITKQ